MQSATLGNALPRVPFPEDAGVSSKAVLDFLKEVEENGIELHSFMVLRGGKVACECFRAPYEPKYRHQMWSVSKSFAATALGIAIDEGFLTLDTPVMDIFPEYRPKKKDENLEKLTFRHLVTMTAGKSPPYLSPKGENADWIKTYVNASWYNEPGVEYRYINENFFMICAALVRVTGMSIIEYLTPRLFEPLGIADLFWETNNRGVEAGGWGVFCRTEDLAKFMRCYQLGGKWEGKKVIPGDWAREATVYQTPSVGIHKATKVGYGFGFWMNPGEGYRANGMFCQFGVDFVNHDGLFICNCSHTEEQIVQDLVFKYFPAAFIEPGSEETVPSFHEALAASKVEEAPAASRRAPALEDKINGTTIRLRKYRLVDAIGFAFGSIPAIVNSKTPFKPCQMNDIRINFEEDGLRFAWAEGTQKNEVFCAMNGGYDEHLVRVGGIAYKMLCFARWNDDDTLLVQLRAIESIATQRFTFQFSGSRVRMTMRSTPYIETIAEFLYEGSSFLFKSPLILKVLRLVIMQLPRIGEPKVKGKLG